MTTSDAVPEPGPRERLGTARAWASRHRRALGLAGAAAATGMAVLWTVVVPERADQVDGLQALAIRWGHPATWALLAVVGLLVATGASQRLRGAIAWASLACYASFLIALTL